QLFGEPQGVQPVPAKIPTPPRSVARGERVKEAPPRSPPSSSPVLPLPNRPDKGNGRPEHPRVAGKQPVAGAALVNAPAEVAPVDDSEAAAEPTIGVLQREPFWTRLQSRLLTSSAKRWAWGIALAVAVVLAAAAVFVRWRGTRDVSAPRAVST